MRVAAVRLILPKNGPTQVMVTRCWSNFDHHLGLVHNSWRCCNLQWRADPGDGLARSYPCFIAVVHWHFLAPALERVCPAISFLHEICRSWLLTAYAARSIISSDDELLKCEVAYLGTCPPLRFGGSP